jgi:hypothetical protein
MSEQTATYGIIIIVILAFICAAIPKLIKKRKEKKT